MASLFCVGLSSLTSSLTRAIFVISGRLDWVLTWLKMDSFCGAKKVEQLISNESIRARALELKEIILKTRAEGGHSSKNFKNFIKWLK
jgi:hypothetical protein